MPPQAASGTMASWAGLPHELVQLVASKLQNDDR